MIKIKYLSPLISEKTEETENYEFRIALENIESFTGRLLGNSDIFNNGNIFKKGDLLFNKLRPYLCKVVLAPEAGIAVTEMLVLRPEKEILNKFLFYRLISYDFIDIVDGSTYGAKMPRANWSFIGNLKIPLPSYKEQMIIASFLDEKLGNIDALIADKEKIVELLQEYRQSLISEAVTKGIDSDVEMKESGIEWIGEIPENWGIKKIKHISKIVLGKMLTNNDKGGYFYKPYLRAQNIIWEKVDLTSLKKMWFSKKELKKLKLHQGDLLVSEGGEVGRTAIWNNEIDECYIQNSVHKITFNKNHLSRYYLYLFEFYGKIGYFKSIVNRVSIAHLTREKLKEIFCITPNFEEQKKIVSFLDQKANEINTLILNIQNQIKKLNNYRQSLISEAVTGKIDVRNYN